MFVLFSDFLFFYIFSMTTLYCAHNRTFKMSSCDHVKLLVDRKEKEECQLSTSHHLPESLLVIYLSEKVIGPIQHKVKMPF